MCTVQIDSITELLQFNTDGVPVFNSGSQSLWPILRRVMKPSVIPVFILALFSGRKNPNDFNKFLPPFVDEAYEA